MNFVPVVYCSAVTASRQK